MRRVEVEVEVEVEAMQLGDGAGSRAWHDGTTKPAPFERGLVVSGWR